MLDLEKLGAFYLGKRYDIDTGNVLDETLLYESKDLTTHGVCVGMTGSGKTGLCLSLIEEAALDGIPVLAIDPKGDLGNLMLTFPDLKPEDFRPWVDENEAVRKGLDASAYARKTAETWKKGLAEWDQDGKRIKRLRDSAEVTIYTPGSTAGVPITVLRSFDAPPAAVAEDKEALNERIQSAVSGMLALLGVDGDPLRSREHILLSTILNCAWSAGRSLDLPALIRDVQNPPFDTVGVFDLESFYAPNDRLELAMRINNLIASPGFSTWLEGEPLDIGRMMFTDSGKPRIAVLSIAHLGESERMFFVTILLNELLTWMRGQPGTSSLRALLYMDEIFGFFPPTAEPPSKKPMLTLLKQARAYGVGVMLATQNPVDLDYKGLSNTGTWFIGRLQTERDKLRVLDGLEGASTTSGIAFDRRKTEATLSGLGSRVFLMNNVHDEEPVIFHTRWAMSYLRGPMTRSQIETLMANRKQTTTLKPPKNITPAPLMPRTETTAEMPKQPSKRAKLPASIDEFFVPMKEAVGDNRRLVYRPVIATTSRLHYVSAKAKLDTWIDMAFIAPVPQRRPVVDWKIATAIPGADLELNGEGRDDASFSKLPAPATLSKNYTQWKKELKSFLYQNRTLKILKCNELKTVSKPGEPEGEFRGRIGHLAHEKRDLEVEKIKKRYSKKLDTLRDRLRRAEDRIEREKAQYGQQKISTAISIGSTILGALMGRKLTSVGSATTAARGASRASRERGDIQRAIDEMEAQQEKLRAMEDDFQQSLEKMEEKLDPSALEFSEINVRPRKSDIVVHELGLAWTPWRVDADGIAEPLFNMNGGSGTC